jgi:hypothetical protein
MDISYHIEVSSNHHRYLTGSYLLIQFLEELSLQLILDRPIDTNNFPPEPIFSIFNSYTRIEPSFPHFFSHAQSNNITVKTFISSISSSFFTCTIQQHNGRLLVDRGIINPALVLPLLFPKRKGKLERHEEQNRPND